VGLDALLQPAGLAGGMDCIDIGDAGTRCGAVERDGVVNRPEVRGELRACSGDPVDVVGGSVGQRSGEAEPAERLEGQPDDVFERVRTGLGHIATERLSWSDAWS
jgi:hypothetical protein